jgi:hypothetical protein
VAWKRDNGDVREKTDEGVGEKGWKEVKTLAETVTDVAEDGEEEEEEEAAEEETMREGEYRILREVN